MTLPRVLAFIHAYTAWLYAAGLLVLVYSLYELREARKNRVETIFSLEKEFAAARERRAFVGLALGAIWLAGLTIVRFGVLPTQRRPPIAEPTPTRMVIELPTTVPATPTLTPTRIPTRPRPTEGPPTPTPTSTPVPPPPCPLPNVCITSPAANQTVSGQVSIRGTVQSDSFQFYKVEYGLGESPEAWNSIGDVQLSPVADGVLAVWDTSGFPNGVAHLRLTVVDVTGNFSAPFDVPVIVQN